MTVAPNWSKYIVDYIKYRLFPKNANRAWKKAIEMESKDYEIIADQLYKRGKDHQLRLVVTKAEYVRVLKQAHEGISGGHFLRTQLQKQLWWQDCGGQPYS